MDASEMGKKGGKARWNGVSSSARSAHGRKAALARWKKYRNNKKSNA